MNVRCAACQSNIRLGPSAVAQYAGRRVRCPNCGQPVRLPALAEPSKEGNSTEPPRADESRDAPVAPPTVLSISTENASAPPVCSPAQVAFASSDPPGKESASAEAAKLTDLLHVKLEPIRSTEGNSRKKPKHAPSRSESRGRNTLWLAIGAGGGLLLLSAFAGGFFLGGGARDVIPQPDGGRDLANAAMKAEGRNGDVGALSEAIEDPVIDTDVLLLTDVDVGPLVDAGEEEPRRSPSSSAVRPTGRYRECVRCKGSGVELEECNECNGSGQELCRNYREYKEWIFGQWERVYCIGGEFRYRQQDHNGNYQQQVEKCSVCNGVGFVRCLACAKGSQKRQCSKCGGEGEIREDE